MAVKLVEILSFLLLAIESRAHTILPIRLQEKIQLAGYVFDVEKSQVIRMGDGTFIARVFDADSAGRGSIVAVNDEQLDIIETSRKVGQKIVFELKDVNADGAPDVSIFEKIGSYWSARIYINKQGYRKAFEGVSILQPELVDFGPGKELQLIMMFDPFGFRDERTYCGALYELRHGKYYQVE
ncbi:MAG: hypothetical protein D6694_12325 [Gammaproteobacteria bacterium]|nr:MAG: hypothetical protein D6694_12325 [Gammaproteobacteria bacterium]